MKKKDTFSTMLALTTCFIVYKNTKKMIAIGQGGDGKRFHMPHLPKRQIIKKQISLSDFNPFRGEGGRG